MLLFSQVFIIDIEYISFKKLCCIFSPKVGKGFVNDLNMHNKMYTVKNTCLNMSTRKIFCKFFKSFGLEKCLTFLTFKFKIFLYRALFKKSKSQEISLLHKENII